ncbi:hypothetical protein [Streptantibioticus ferralitis]|uniref:Uncharacterized protein n=1 Tax=Streptantibioticus ferralitis TaxID=236510 RepID=A0ABT5Z5L3_9ACTN|nr:hypothetical protein [Streptantibioticus ferralitis]MDF2258826.1 hypothetical protein [Streptantibioticus ferralitis]
MNLRKRITAIAATTTLAGLATLGLTVPAHADAAHQTMAAAGGTAPACIHRRDHGFLGYVRISNWYGKTMRVRVIIDRGPSSPCRTLANGQAFSWDYDPSLFQSYHKTVVC